MNTEGIFKTNIFNQEIEIHYTHYSDEGDRWTPPAEETIIEAVYKNDINITDVFDRMDNINTIRNLKEGKKVYHSVYDLLVDECYDDIKERQNDFYLD